MQELTGLPRAVFRTIEKHAHLDPHHRDDLLAAIDALPLEEEHHQMLGTAALTTIETASALYRECANSLSREIPETLVCSGNSVYQTSLFGFPCLETSMTSIFRSFGRLGCLSLALGLLAGCDTSPAAVPVHRMSVIPPEEQGDFERLLVHLQSGEYYKHQEAMTCLLRLPTENLVPQLIERYQTAGDDVALRGQLAQVFAGLREQGLSAANLLAEDYCGLVSPDSSELETQLRFNIVAALAAFGDSPEMFPPVYQCLVESQNVYEVIELLHVVAGLTQPPQLSEEQYELVQQRLLDSLAFAVNDVELTAKLLPAATWFTTRMPVEGTVPEPLQSAIGEVIQSLEQRLSQLVDSEPPETTRRPAGRRRSHWVSNPRHREWTAQVTEIQNQLTSFRELVGSPETSDNPSSPDPVLDNP